jgi:hypothetical protein
VIAYGLLRAAPIRIPSRGVDRPAGGWLVHGHHPDLLRMPEPRPGRAAEDRLRAALAWNVFRTLGAIDPSRWLRSLHARLFGFDERYRAPEWLRVGLWVPDGAGRPGESIDVVLESATAVWAFLTAFERDVIAGRADVDDPDPLLRTTAAAARLAGGRRLFVALLSSPAGTAPIGQRLVRRYAAAPGLLRSRLPAEAAGVDLGGVGAGGWATCATVLAACAAAPAVGAPERQAARRCLRWLSAHGIEPDG